MATDKKVKRLSKVAKEFNVGIHTLVDYLNKKGYNVDTNPNAKVSPEQYELLLKEYSSEIDVKRQSEKIGKSYSETKSSISVGDMDKKEAETETETETEDKNKGEKEDELFIKDVSGKKAEAQDTEEKEEEATTEKEEKSEEDQQETTEPKVVGKIDLDSFGKSKKKKKEEPP